MVSHHSVHSQATENGKVLSSESDSSQGEGVGAEEEDNVEAGKSGIETSSDEQEVSKGEDQQECPHTQDTLTGVSQLFGEHEDTDPESNSGQKVQTAWQKQCKDSPKEDSPKKDSSRSSSSEEEPPTNEALQDGARQKVQLLDTGFDACHHDKIANNVMGFYALGMTGDPPDFPTLWELVTCSQVRDLLKFARSIGRPYVILAHSADFVTTVSML